MNLVYVTLHWNRIEALLAVWTKQMAMIVVNVILERFLNALSSCLSHCCKQIGNSVGLK